MQNSKTVELAAHVISAFVSNNAVSVTDLSNVIRRVYDALNDLGQPQPVPEVDTFKPTPAQVRKSITSDHLISFLDGKPYKTLKRHLTTHGVTIADYKARFGLPNDYPTTAPSYSAARSAMAKSLGLGLGGRASKAAPTPAPKTRAKNPSKTKA